MRRHEARDTGRATGICRLQGAAARHAGASPAAPRDASAENRCLYVGDQQAYAEYKRLALQKQIAESASLVSSVLRLRVREMTSRRSTEVLT